MESIFKKTGINFEKTNGKIKKFYKIMNSSRIILNEKLSDIGKMNSFFIEKLDRVETSLKIRFKRNTEIINDTVEIIQAELNHIFGQFEKFFIIDVILNKLVYDMKNKYEVNKN